MPKLSDFREEFLAEFFAQQDSDELRWGDTWLHRTREGQEERVFERYRDYLDQFRYAGKPIPWMKVVGEAYIAWVRENHPELFPL